MLPFCTVVHFSLPVEPLYLKGDGICFGERVTIISESVTSYACPAPQEVLAAVSFSAISYTI